MANDNLSGIITTAFISKELLNIQEELEHSYRIIFIPETIGAISYCAVNEKVMRNIENALVITTCGGPGQFGYKQSWENNNSINYLIEDVFNENSIEFKTYPYDIRGSDERHFSSQGFRINCATITKDKYYEYDCYHTSLDNLNFVNANNLYTTINLYLQLINKMDKNIVYKNLYPNCEVMLSKYDLYPETGGSFLPQSNKSVTDIILWLLHYCDGKTSLYQISRILTVNINMLYKIAKQLERKKILKK